MTNDNEDKPGLFVMTERFSPFEIGISLGVLKLNIVKLPDVDTPIVLNLFNWTGLFGKKGD